MKDRRRFADICSTGCYRYPKSYDDALQFSLALILPLMLPSPTVEERQQIDRQTDKL